MRLHKRLIFLCIVLLLSSRSWAATFTVTTTADAGAGSLRQAITDANTTESSPHLIEFNIPTSEATTESGVQFLRIAPVTALPAITREAIFINGSSQTREGLASPPPGPVVKIDGILAGNSNGISIEAAYCTVEGFVISNFKSTNRAGIYITSGRNRIIGNYIGTNITGMTTVEGNYHGVYIANGAFNMIGGSTLESEGNLISGNSNYGVYIAGAGSSSNEVMGNYIGTNRQGTGEARNSVAVYVNQAYYNKIGSSEATKRNILSGNSTYGVYLIDCASNEVKGNYIGLNATGTASVENSRGIWLNNSFSNDIGGATTTEGNVISGNRVYAIYISGANSRNNRIRGNYIGTDATGETKVSVNNVGIYILPEAGPHYIGGAITGEGNVISGHPLHGIQLRNSSNEVKGNLVGTNKSGTSAIPNRYGIYIDGGRWNIIGGTLESERNILSGNSNDGISVWGSSNEVVGNYCGTKIDGTTALPNTNYGVYAESGSNNIFRKNVMSGNSKNGMFIYRGANNWIKENFIGTDKTGTVALSNVLGGLLVFRSDNLVIGGTVEAERNIISGNDTCGIWFYGNASAEVKNNYIGVNVNKSGLGNKGSGVYFENGSNRILLQNNIIASNEGAGIHLLPNCSYEVFRANSIYENLARGISLEAGANNGIQKPVITFSNYNYGAGTTVGGTSSPSAVIEIFKADPVIDLYNQGEGKTYLGSTEANGSGRWSFTTAEGVSLGDSVTATQTKYGSSGNTSEFAFNSTVEVLYTVITTADAGNGSLRQAIHNANAASGTEPIPITFNIPTSEGTSGVDYFYWSIEVTEALPALTREAVVIDGTTQPTDETYNNPYGPVIGIRGEGTTGFSGLIIGTSNCTIEGLLINYFGFGVEINGSGYENNRIAGCYIGTTATGEGADGNSSGVYIGGGAKRNVVGGNGGQRNIISGNVTYGVFIGNGTTSNEVKGNYIGIGASGDTLLGNNNSGVYIGNGANYNIIGGATALETNVISGNGDSGVYLHEANFNEIKGNYIGTDASGMEDRGNTSYGIYLRNAHNNKIGSITPGERNVISGNDASGIYFLTGDGSSTSNEVKGNYIGTGVDGTSNLGNLVHGVEMGGGVIQYNEIGPGNIIAYNGSSTSDHGVYVAYGNYNLITRNSMEANAGKGINLESGANDDIPIPDIISVHFNVPASGYTTITGTSTADAEIEIFKTEDGEDAFNQGEGKVYLKTVTAEGENWIATIEAGKLSKGDKVTATATKNLNTSEFALNSTVETLSVILRTPNGGETWRATTARNITWESTGYPTAINLYYTTGEGWASIDSIDGTLESYAWTIPSAPTTEARVSVEAIGTGISSTDASDMVFAITAENIMTVTTTRDSGEGSLRQCITDANSHAGADTIIFNIPTAEATSEGGVKFWRIYPQSQLPELTEAVHIDGTTQPTSDAYNNPYGPEIEIRGKGNPGIDGIVINSANCTIEGLVLNNFQNIIYISGSGNDNNRIVGNYIGTNITGETSLSSDNGIAILSGSQGNIIGGNSVLNRNVISGNTNSGVSISDATTINNRIIGNYIGTNKYATSGVGNSYGILIGSAAQNTIGGTTEAERNIISANSYHGIYISGTTASDNQIIGNYIGTKLDGLSSLPNSDSGVYILSGASRNAVGGNRNDGYGNLISGNSFAGVRIENLDTASNEVKGNFIGVTSLGADALPNASGVYINGAPENIIGGTLEAEGNLISGNQSYGIYILGNNATSNEVLGNYIGTDISGNNPLPNSEGGIYIFIGPSYTKIGPRNLIARNGWDGISIYGDCRFNVITQNSMEANVGKGIRLDAGANFGIPEPVITFVSYDTPGSGEVTIYGALTGYMFTEGEIEIFKTETVSVDAYNQGEGRYYLTTVTAESSSWIATVEAGKLNKGDKVTATATTNLNTSEFALNRTVLNAFTVVTTEDAGDGSLRQVITDANARPVSEGTITIQFNIPTSEATMEGGVTFWRIEPQSALPAITREAIYINGNTQKLFIGGDPNPYGPEIELRGPGALLLFRNGISIEASSCTIEGLVINNFRRGISISGINARRNRIIGNYIGTRVTGEAALDNIYGIYIDGAPSNVIGGQSFAERNIISGNTEGVYITGSNSTSNEVKGNYIGTNADGNLAIPNNYGVDIENAPYNIIGGNLSEEKNIISGNAGGIAIEGAGAASNEVKGNYIGTNVSGNEIIGNYTGIQIGNGASYNVIGGAAVAERNIISGNSEVGIYIYQYQSKYNKVIGNYIGTDATGTLDRGNVLAGVWILEGAKYNLVGGAGSEEKNVISGNDWFGVWISDPGTNSNEVKGNYIGTNASGTAAIGNSIAGVSIEACSYNIIGGTSPGEGNVISGNDGDGICFFGALSSEAKGNYIASNGWDGIHVTSTSSYILISQNSMEANAGKGISLEAGANKGAIKPDILTAYYFTATGDTLLAGTAEPSAVIEIFKTEEGEDLYNQGEGKYYITTITAEASTGTWEVYRTDLDLSPGQRITATATKYGSGGNTSEFAINSTIESDAAVPTVEVIAPNGGEFWRGNDHYDITWNASDPSGIDEIRIYYTSGEAWLPITVEATNDGSYNWLLPGINTTEAKVRIEAVDSSLSHNVGTDESDAYFTIDSTTPEAPTLVSPSDEAFVSDNTPDFIWTLPTDMSGIASVEIVIDATATTLGAVTSYTPTTALSDGLHTWEVRCKDGAGRWSEYSSSRKVTVDTNFPNIESITIKDPITGSRYYTNQHNVSVEVAASGNPSEMILSEFSNFAEAIWQSYAEKTIFTLSGQGVRTVYCKIRDKALNESSVQYGSITLDTIPPIVLVEQPKQGDVLISGESYEIKWSVNEVYRKKSTLYYSTDNKNTWNTIGEVGPNLTTYSWTAPNILTYNGFISIEAEDEAGNIGYGLSGQFRIQAPVEKRPTVVTLSQNGVVIDRATTATFLNTVNFDISVISPDDDELNKLLIKLNNANIYETFVGGKEYNTNISYTPEPGTYTLTIIVTSKAPNAAPVDEAPVIYNIEVKQQQEKTVQDIVAAPGAIVSLRIPYDLSQGATLLIKDKDGNSIRELVIPALEISGVREVIIPTQNLNRGFYTYQLWRPGETTPIMTGALFVR